MSPVRPVLALPSPKMELLGSPSTTVAAGSNVSNLGGLRQVRTVLLAVKASFGLFTPTREAKQH
jgi:hypothetical protein